MTAPGAEGIIPPVSNSPLIWWHFRLFGPYIGSDIIGLTEITAATLIVAGCLRPKAGVVCGFIAALMFFTTSTMIVTTPGAIISVPGVPYMRYMSFLGLFLFKNVISLGVSFYLISYFGRKAILAGKMTKRRTIAASFLRVPAKLSVAAIAGISIERPAIAHGVGINRVR